MNRGALLACAVGALTLTACPGGVVEDDGNDTTTNATGGNGGAGGTGGMVEGGGGQGGDPGPCGQDCSEIDTMNPCLVGVCNEGQFAGEVGSCVIVPADSETECDDGLFCTVNDHCGTGDDEGQCVGGPTNDCDMTPSTPCVNIQCNESQQTCNEVPAEEGSACTPTDLCMVNGQCNNGLCVGVAKDCTFAPDNECNNMTCDPGTGNCVIDSPDPSVNGQTCTLSGDKCDTGKTCLDGVCGGGTPKDCSFLTVACDEGVCNPANGFCEAIAIPENSECFDLGGANPDCNAGLCDAGGTCVVSPANNGGSCNDFDTCTENDTCDANGMCSGSAVSNCTVYAEANFETCPPPGWTLAAPWECGTPTSGPNAAFAGTGVLATVLAGNYPTSQTYDAAIVDTPVFSLASATEPVLSFYAYTHTESCCDGFNIKISTDGGANFVVVPGTDVTPPYDGTVNSQPAWRGNLSAQGYRFHTADLTPYVGATNVVVRISFRSDGSVQNPGIYIDDFQIGEANQVPLEITTANLPDAYDGFPYTATVMRNGGSTAAQWSLMGGGTNDAWLTIDPNTGVLSGTPGPAEVGPVIVNVHVEEPALPSNFADATLMFNVTQALAFENFEVCPGIFTLMGEWQCGAPTNPMGPLAAFSGNNVIAVGRTANYPNGLAYANNYARVGPIDLTGLTNVTITFQGWLHTETNWDGFNISGSTDGVNFALIDFPNITPDYQDDTVGTEPAWTGDFAADGYSVYTVDADAYAGMNNVYFEFAFYSDGIINDVGVFLDDFVIAGN